MKTVISHNAKILAIFAVVCTAVVSLVSMLTKDEIAKQEQQQLLSTLHQVIAPERFDNDLYHTCQFVQDTQLLGSKETQTSYLAMSGEDAVAVAITAVAPDGYNGNIHLLVAINVDGSVSGVRILKHLETPGLGDKVEIRKSDWVLSFNEREYEGVKDKRWTVKKDGGIFDQFTGATITPRAVVKAVKNALIYFDQNKSKLLDEQHACRGNDEQ